MQSKFFDRSELTRSLYHFRREFLWVGIFSMIANLLMLSPSLYMMQVFDRVLISHSELTLIFLTIIIAIFFCVMALSEWLRSRLLVRVGIRLDQELSTRVFKANFQACLEGKLKIPFEAFSNLTTVRQFITSNGAIAFFDAPWIPIYIFVLYLLHPFLGLLAILFGTIQMLAAIYGRDKISLLTDSMLDAEGKSKSFLHSKLKNSELVAAMGMQNNLIDRWLKFDDKFQQISSSSQGINSRQEAITKLIRYCMQSLTLGFAAILVIRGELSAGSMLAANVLMGRALQPLDLIVGSWTMMFRAKNAFNQLEHLLEGYPEKGLGKNGSLSFGVVKLINLTASVNNRNKPILYNLNVEFLGHVTAIIGPSGSGKSTLAKCLLGIWPNYSGDILFDNRDVRNLSRELLGPHIGYLPQDVELMEGTIAENINRFYEADPEKIIDAAKLAGVHEMILRFPDGYDTKIGQLGHNLSGGQRQRIALARALYGNPSLIVLDEPNANLDEVGERALIQAVINLKAQGKYVFIITHRLNILEIVDYMLVLGEGKILQYGTRDEVLLAMKKLKHN